MGKYKGSLKDYSATTLVNSAAFEAISRANLEVDDLQEAVIGSSFSNKREIELRYPMKDASAKSVPLIFVDDGCHSGLKAVTLAADSIQLGQVESVLCGGVESMSNSMIQQECPRSSKRLRETTAKDKAILCFGGSIGYDACQESRRLMEKYGISDSELYRYSAMSRERALKATSRALFEEELAGLLAPEPLANSIVNDEVQAGHLGGGALPESGGEIIEGSTSAMGDGAACLVAMSREEARRRRVEPLFSIIDYSRMQPRDHLSGKACADSITGVLAKSGFALGDISLLELHESSAASVMATGLALGLDFSKVNINGGALAFGHPVGCSGARMLVTLYYALKHSDGHLGLLSIEAANGSSMALLMEREN